MDSSGWVAGLEMNLADALDSQRLSRKEVASGYHLRPDE